MKTPAHRMTIMSSGLCWNEDEFKLRPNCHCDTVWRVRCNVVQCDAVWCSVMQWDTGGCSVMQRDGGLQGGGNSHPLASASIKTLVEANKYQPLRLSNINLSTSQVSSSQPLKYQPLSLSRGRQVCTSTSRATLFSGTLQSEARWGTISNF